MLSMQSSAGGGGGGGVDRPMGSLNNYKCMVQHRRLCSSVYYSEAHLHLKDKGNSSEGSSVDILDKGERSKKEANHVKEKNVSTRHLTVNNTTFHHHLHLESLKCWIVTSF